MIKQRRNADSRPPGPGATTDHEAAVQRFLDVVARMMARAHLRRRQSSTTGPEQREMVKRTPDTN